MKKPNARYGFKENATLFNTALRDLKKGLPSKCTFLSLIKKATGELAIRAMIKNSDGTKDGYVYTIPQDLMLTQADYSRIQELITKKCEEYV